MDSVTIRLRKVMRNPLLQRKQAVLECIHPNKANVSQKTARAQIAKMMKVSDDSTALKLVKLAVLNKAIAIFVVDQVTKWCIHNYMNFDPYSWYEF